ncbi:hypothetical protein PR048_012483, partial [Dryococelus australis]
MKHISDILQLFDRATFIVSSLSNVCSSEVIPIINRILQQLQVPSPAGFWLTRHASMKMRCGQVEEIWLYTAATLLDPRYKGKVFSDRRYLDTAIDFSAARSREKEFFKAISVETVEKAAGSAVCASAVDEVQTYVQEPFAPPDTNVLTYWKNKHNLPRLRRLARKHLITPAATVFSERLFSTAGLIVDKKRKHLDPDTVKML